MAKRIAVNAPREKARRARSLMQTRQHILKQRNMTINSVKALLRSVGVEMKQAKLPKEEHWEKVLNDPAVPLWMKPSLRKWAGKLVVKKGRQMAAVLWPAV